MGKAAAKSGNPHGAIGVDGQVLHRVAFKTLDGARLERRKPYSIEANEASAGGQPEIPVRGLLDPAHGRDAGVPLPRGVGILRKCEVWVQRVQGQTGGREREYEDVSPPLRRKRRLRSPRSPPCAWLSYGTHRKP